jgi:hypothetical protein
MSITAGVKVPTSYRNLQTPKIKGLAWYVVASWAGFFVLASLSGLVFIYTGAPRIPAVLIPLSLFAILAFFTVRDKYHTLRTYKHLLLIVRTFQKDHEFKKYRSSLDDIKKLVPIELITDSGLIRYVNGTSAVLITLAPPRISDDNIDVHNTRVMNVINSLYGEYAFHFISISSKENYDDLATSTAQALNATGLTQPANEHLYSIYEYAINAGSTAVEWDFLLFVYLPYSKTVEEAENNKEAFLSGLTKELIRAGILSNVVDNRNAVITMLRTIITARK